MRTKPKFADSAEKVIEALALLQPRDNPIYLWPSIFRVLHCKEGCSWCCMRFTLDYIPEELALLSEAVRARFQPRKVQRKCIWTLDQYRLSGCPFLKEQGWGCSLYPLAPISCMMAPQIHISMDTRVNGVAIYAKRFSRPTAKGFAPCEFHVPEADAELRRELERNIVLWKRLHSWATYFGFDTVIPEVVRQLETTPAPRRTIEVYGGSGGIWGLLK